MKGKEGPPILAALAILLFAGQHVESLNLCPALPISPTYCSSVNSVALNTGLESGKWCQFTLPQHACASVSNLTSSQLSAILQCYITDPAAHLDQGAFVLLFQQVGREMLQTTLNEISVQIVSDQITPAAKAFLLNAAWEVLKADPRVQNAGFLASWFQETLHAYLTTIDTNLLDCMTQLPITCDGLATVVQALDSVYTRLNNSTRQLVADWIGRFLTAYVCQKSSAKEWLLSNWKSFRHYASYNEFTASWSGFDGFAALDVLTASQLAQLTATHNVFSNSSRAAGIIHLLSTSDILYLDDYLTELSTLTLTPPFDRDVMYSMLEAILRRVNESFPDICSPSLKDLFQVKLKMLLPVTDANILTLFPTKIGCTDFQDIYKGLNSVHSELHPNTQKAIYIARLNFLNGQVAKEGVACTFTADNSRDWLQENFGLSSVYADYNDLIRFYPGFNGYEVTNLLTATQLGKLVVMSSILTDSIRVNAEVDATNVMNTLQSRNVSELQTFLYEVNTLVAQMNIVSITNINVREAMLKGIFRILKPRFASMTVTDLESWFDGTLTLYLASITHDELMALPAIANCTQLQTMVKGLDYAFDQMTMETKTDVTQWIVKALLQIDCQTTENWMPLNFQRFKTVANITDFTAIDSNFSGMAHLKDLTAIQLAQLTLTQEVFSSVNNTELVFDRLAEMPGLEALAAYWDEFNIAYEKANGRNTESQTTRLRIPRSLPQPFVNTLNISMEVKHTMLARTVEQLHIAFPTFTDADYDLWFKKRLVIVLPSIKTDVLQKIPISLSCSSYKSLIAGFNTGFSEIPEEGKRDVYHYIVSFLTQTSQDTGPVCDTELSTRDWLLEFFGKFSMEASYTQLISFSHQPFDAYTVLDMLTPTQIGDMIVNSDTLTRMDLAAQLIQFFQQSKPEDVQIVLKQFTKAASMHKISVLPDDAVTQLLLENYLTVMTVQMAEYTATDWNATFQNELYFLSPVISKTTLTFIVPQDYDSLVAIVAGFDGAYQHMTESSRRAVVLWIVQNLQVLKGYSVESITEWIQTTWRSFFSDATLEEVKSTNKNFDPADFLDLLSADQLMEYVVTSDALFNVTTMIRVLRSLEGKDSEISLPKMDEFLTKFNLAITQENIVGVQNAEVRQEMLTMLFTDLSKHFYKFTDLDYEAWFLKKLKFLLPSMNAELLELIPVDVSFPSYTAIIGGLDNVFPEFSQQTSHDVYNLIQKILEHQLNASESVFPGTYSNSESFLQLIFYRFRHFANYTHFLTFYKDFNGYDVLDLLSAGQMGEMMVVTNAVRNERFAVQILVEMETRSFTEMTEFIMEFNAVAEQKHLIVLPNPWIRDLVFETIFKSFQFSTFTAEQYAFWFGSQLQLFLPAINAQYLQLLPLDIDCRSHQNLVQALDKAYNHYTDEQRRAIHGRIFRFLESYHNTQGGTCSPGANSSQWIIDNYERFGAYATLEEFASLSPNFDGMSAVSELAPEQLAQLTTATGALADETLLKEIMKNLNTSPDLAKFFDTLNAVASAELQSSVHAHLILSTAFQKIAADFPKFKAGDFAYWFQVAFQNVLHTVNETLLAEIPVSISCDSYQQMLKGFNNVYISIPAGDALSVFGFCSAFLASKVKLGIACGSTSQSIQNWLDINLGNFSKYAKYQDLLAWNQHFNGMTVLEKLTPPQLASLTLESGAINEEEVMCQVLARLQNKPADEIYQYLDQFNKDARQLMIPTVKNEAVRKSMLAQFVNEIKSGYSAFSPEDWTHLFTRLELLLPSTSEMETKLFLTHISGCDSFRAIVSSLSQVYPSLSSVNQQGIYNALLTFLENQYNTTGSACALGNEGSLDWLQNNFGAFAAKARYEDFTRLMANFNGFDVSDNLTSAQLAHVFFGTDVLEDIGMVDTLLESLQSRPVGDVVAFVTEFVTMAPQQGIVSLPNTQVRDAMFSVIFSKVRGQFTTFSIFQYKDWFQNKLRLWLASINASALATIPKKIPCGVYQIIMASLDSSFQHMSPASQQDVYSFAKDYLTTKASQGGDPCTENTRGSLGWLHVNLGSFSISASYGDLVAINADFSAIDAVAGLSPEQLASYVLASDVLRDSDKAGKVFGSLNSHTIGDFMYAFNAAAQEHHLYQLSHADVRRFILGEIFCHLSTAFKLFTTEDYIVWFGERLTLFLSSLNAQNLGFLPTDMSCDSLAAIVKILSDHKANGTYENPQDIFSFIKRVLHSQLQNSGSACAQGITTDRQWLLQYFGFSTVYGSYSDFLTLKSKFHGQDSLDLFSASALAQLSAQSNAIYSTEAIQLVFEAIGSKEEPLQHLSTYLDDLNALLLKSSGLLGNSKVRDTMLMMSAKIVFPQITAMSLEDTATWFHRLNLLLPGVNATTLELLPLTMSCPFYQAIIKAISGVYSALSVRKRQDVYGFQKAYLNAQFTDSGSACEDGTNGTRDWLQKNMGEFCSMAQLSELQTFFPNIDGIDVIGKTNLNDVAELLTKLEIIANTTMLEKIILLIPPENTTQFLNAAMSAAKEANLTDSQMTALNVTMLTAVWNKFSSSFSNFMLLDWRHLFRDLRVLLPGINTTHLQLIPTNISCSSYQEIATALSNAYTQFPEAAQDSIYKYLLAVHRDSTLKCYTGPSLKAFLDTYFVKFSTKLTAEDLVALIPSSQLSEKIGSLQPGELLDILIKPGSPSNHPALETLLRKYEDISKIGTVLDGLNQQVNMNNESLKAVLNGVWPHFVTALSSLNSSSLDQWFNKRLQTYLPLITQSQLNTSEILTTNCLGFRHLVKALNIHYHDYTVEMQQGIYNILKNYLLQPGDKPKCYNESDGNQNSTAWFLNYLGKYLTYCTGDDLRAFSDSQQLLQDFAVDPQNLVLVGGLALAEEVKEYYSDLIVGQNPPLALGSIPANLICSVASKLNISQTTATEAMGALVALQSCLRPSQDPAGEVSGALPDITGNLSVETFKRLGPFAVRLTPSMLLAKADGQTLQQVLPLLSATGGWSPAQASVIMNKVIQNGYQINKASSVLIMGKLALGLPVNVLDKLDNEDILLLAADENFTDSLEQAPLPVKYKFVQRILQSTTGSPFLSTPDKLADQIPQSRLASPQMKIDEINQKKWAAAQASVFFQAVLKSTQQYSSLSSTVLQGFSCGAANFLNNSQFASLAKAMKGKRIRLEDRQLSCMTKRLKGRITPSDLEEYPAEVLFYVGPETFANTVNCQKYFHLVGQANIDFLPSGSSKRESLLESAKACLGTSTLFSKENLQILGNLSCTLNGYYIAKSDPYILTILQSCMSFTEDQLVAIEQQLENKYGSPSTWTVSTLTDMGIIASALRSGTLQRISETEKTQFFPDFLSQLKTRNRNQFIYILEQLANPQRQKRAADCTRTPLTTEVVMKQRDLLASKYTSSRDLDACLPDDVLQNNLETFGKMEFQDPLLQVLKLKLDKIFGTLPEDYLPLLGNIARMYNTTEIAQWNITTAETLSALLTGTSWHEELLKVTSLVIRYLEVNGNQLDAMMLTVLAPHICALEDTQLKAISRKAIRGTSRPMNTTLCSQHKKNLLYRQLQAAYEEDQSSPDAYYQLMKPALGGAPTKDLIKFASSYPVMDVDTFTALNPTEVKQLSTQHLKDLLGDNLPELNNLADHPVVKAWTQAHSQSEVNSLGLHLIAGLPDQPPNGFINIPSVPHIPGRATTNVKDHTLQLFYCILFNLVLVAFL